MDTPTNRPVPGPDHATDNGLFSGIATVFLDRDGVVNRKAPEGEYVSQWAQFHLLPGVAESIAALNHSGRKVFIVTNQRGVALGLYTSADVESLHRQLQQELIRFGAQVDGFYHCPHDKDSCDCRKPLPGMFDQAFSTHPAGRAESSVMIGDSLSDIQAGKRAGMRTIFIEGEPERRKAGAEQAAELADAVASSLAQAVSRFLIA